uniref:Thioredoxin domain-containing protein n=1 Tax=Parascaris equorum TaxID=6256 RepID=A0A914REJ8_PAREQ
MVHIDILHLQDNVKLNIQFPTLYWVPKNAKDKPVPYSGAREVDDFVKFIAKHSTEGLKGYDRDGKKKKKKAEEL